MDIMKNIKRAIYAGTFDPITNGHLDIIKRAAAMFDELIVAIGDNPSKNPMFSVTERMDMIKKVTNEIPNVTSIKFHSLLVDLCDELEATVIIRGVRNVTDFEYELQMTYANNALNKKVETVYLMPTLEYSYISSSVVRTILKFNGKIEHLVPKLILNDIKGKI